VAEERGDVTSLKGVLTGEFVGVGPAGFKLNEGQWLGWFAGGLSYELFALEQRRGQSKPMKGESKWES
jgi:hypothetical protein